MSLQVDANCCEFLRRDLEILREDKCSSEVNHLYFTTGKVTYKLHSKQWNHLIILRVKFTMAHAIMIYCWESISFALRPSHQKLNYLSVQNIQIEVKYFKLVSAYDELLPQLACCCCRFLR